MEGDSGMVIFLLLGAIIIPIILSNNISNKVNGIALQLRKMEALLMDLRKQIKDVAVKTAAENIVPPVFETPNLDLKPKPQEDKLSEVFEEIKPIVPENIHVESAIIAPIIIMAAEGADEIESADSNKNKQQSSAGIIEEIKSESIENIIPVSRPFIKTEPRVKKDWERFIGEKLMSLVGIAILVLGIFFTVKWAIDKKLIGDAGKILIGIICGTALIGVAHKVRKSFRTFSSILVGGGLAVLYFTVYIAYQDYHLLTQIPAFIAMVCVTIFAVILSLLYDRIELAIIALLGGFITPFFVSNNEGNYEVLFSYLLILNIGMLILSNYKKWKLVNIISYVATILIFMGWMTTKFDVAKGHAVGAFVFASLFYLVFFGMNIIYNIRHKNKFGAFEMGMLLSNTFLYFGLGLYCLNFINNGFYNGIFTIILGSFNFGFAYFFYKKRSVDKNLIYLLIGFVLTFVSLTAPIQLHGNYITLFWAAEMVLLYWLGQKSGIQLIRNTSLVVLALALISLIMDWGKIYESQSKTVLLVMFNKAFITGLVMIAALIIKKKLSKLDQEKSIGNIIPLDRYTSILKLLKTAVIYLMFLLEIVHQMNTRIGNIVFTETAIWLYHYLFIAVLFIYARKESFAIQKIVAGATAFLLVLYVFAAKSIFNLEIETLSGHLFPIVFLWHFTIPLLALINLYLLVQFVNKSLVPDDKIKTYTPWFFTVIGLFILSNEIVRIWTWKDASNIVALMPIQTKAIKIALPILWSIGSFALMLLGMRLRLKTYRIISISLFALTILKLFIYDISDVGQGGKIAAFVLLGIILLIVSFLYQKIKGLFVDEEKENEQPSEINE